MSSEPTADLDKYLKSLPDKLVKQLSDAVKREADRLSAAQRQTVRRLVKESTGALEESCTVAPGDHPLEYIVQAGGDLTTTEIREGSGVAFDHALAFEYGTLHQPARPFFYSTYRAMQTSMAQNISNAVKDILSD